MDIIVVYLGYINDHSTCFEELIYYYKAQSFLYFVIIAMCTI
ncbi:hypothetical protein NLO413_1060 [Candidatus Neoehrlichia lotoris str. RAC413]|uniref:Uncharacterized protein n=1 Tax=Candidatus Neoehrlichia procyonis str. RAC413 TaxID=1359163 RepID=A0A0F3NNN0_9RICK|nr:hypothetical protein NLO413_1057 [Candidatus Neoehrlichia lotoris str. RAC413]KJV69658.1 hypothetical protein NLO413_1060 [Candidatus Neoehrlichia lotoris str. RAC413]